MNETETLVGVIRELYGADATHRESVPVLETFKGETVWQGVVEVFDLHHHPEADTVYAWGHDTDDPHDPRRYVAVLGVPPVTNPLMAVRASIARDYYASEANKAARGSA